MAFGIRALNRHRWMALAIEASDNRGKPP